MNLKNLPKVPYRILSYSSEDPDYQHTELLLQGPQCRGWQSSRYCDYPQEIILELGYPTKVQYMQFLSHQCKISTKVEIFAHMPKAASLKSGADYAINPADIRFTKIGSRELKTVYLSDITALYLKFTMHKCHVNNLNQFNQVGLIAVSVFGEGIATNPVQAQLADQQAGFQELEYNMQFDEETLKRMRMLEKARQRAEQNEDYGEAKKLNEAINDLKRVGVNLQKLEERRAIAVKNKDYDSAMVLKKEIDSLRRAKFSDNIQYLAPQGGPQGGFNGHQGYGGGHGDQMGNQEGGGYGAGHARGGNKGQPPSRGGDFNHPDNSRQRRGPSEDNQFERDDGRVPADRLKRHQQANPPIDEQDEFSGVHGKGESRDKTQSFSQVPGGPQSRAQVQPGANNESMVIPALRNKNRIDPSLASPDDDPMGGQINEDNSASLQNAEEIKLADMNKAQPLIPHLSEPIVKGFFSKNWNIRDKAVKVLTQEIQKGSKSEM